MRHLRTLCLWLRGVTPECSHAEKVTSRACDVTPRDARRKQKYIFLLRKITKIKVMHSDFSSHCRLLVTEKSGQIRGLDFLGPI